jgi:hypothetical protein
MSRIDSIPSNPFHIARAYALQTARVAPAGSARPVKVEPIAAIRPQHPQESAKAMIAASVPGGVSFADPAPALGGPSLPLYRHPADKNAAATAIDAGRMLDVQG